MLELITDFIVGINIVLIFGSVFLVLEIFRLVGQGQAYVLARSWKYLVPAVIVIALLRVYDFFVEYSVYSSSRLIQETLFLFFSIFLFAGLMVQFIAIKNALTGRNKS